MVFERNLLLRIRCACSWHGSPIVASLPVIGNVTYSAAIAKRLYTAGVLPLSAYVIPNLGYVEPEMPVIRPLATLKEGRTR